jgi:hypothetical protein
VIDAEKANYPVAFMCRLLAVPRSSFYAWTNRVETPTRARRRTLAVEVAKEFKNSRQTSGCRRITAALNRRGIECSVGLVADLMRELGLAAVQPRAYKRTTLPGKEPVAAPDLIDRDFTAPAPGQRLVGDITYLRTGEGWLYLATVIDLATRMVVGWQTAAHMRTTLVTDALQMAIDSGHVDGDAIFHSDRGTQGGFHRSSQHLMITEVLSGTTSAASGSGSSASDAVTWPANPGAACGARVLAPDRPRHAQRGCGAGSGRVRAGRDALVSSRWRHAASEPCRAHRPVSVIQGTGGACPAEGARPRRPSDRPRAQTEPRHDLARAAPQRGYPWRSARLPSVGRAVEGADRSPATQAGEARHEPSPAGVRAAAAIWAAAAS